MCDFDMAFVDPEMRKKRQAVVVSILANNQRHALASGNCTVVPFTTVAPKTPSPDDIFIPAGTYWSLSKDSWARCKMVATVSHNRLDLILFKGKRRPTEFLTQGHMNDVAQGLVHALGL